MRVLARRKSDASYGGVRELIVDHLSDRVYVHRGICACGASFDVNRQHTFSKRRRFQGKVFECVVACEHALCDQADFCGLLLCVTDAGARERVLQNLLHGKRLGHTLCDLCGKGVIVRHGRDRDCVHGKMFWNIGCCANNLCLIKQSEQLLLTIGIEL